MLSAGMGIGARVLAAQLSRGSDKGQLGRMVGLRRSMSDSQVGLACIHWMEEGVACLLDVMLVL